MNNLQATIQAAVQQSVNTFIHELSSQFTLDKEALTTFANDWWGFNKKIPEHIKQLVSSSPTVSEPPSPHVIIKPTASLSLKEPSKSKKKEKEPKPKKENTCKYTTKTTGKVCGKESLGEYCSFHERALKKETEKQTKLTAFIKPIEEETKETAEESKETRRKMKKQIPEFHEGQEKTEQDLIKKTRKSLVFEKDKTTKRYVNKDHMFVKNAELDCIVGKQTDDGSIVELNANEQELCKEWKLEYIFNPEA